MTDIFADSLDWSAEDIELTEQLIAAADKKSIPTHRACDTSTTVSGPAASVIKDRRVTRSSSRKAAKTAAGPNGPARNGSNQEAPSLPNETSQEDQRELQEGQAGPSTAATEDSSIAEARQQVFVPDLEDIGLVQNRTRFRPHGFSVTDFTAAQWCQQQFALALSARLPEACFHPMYAAPRHIAGATFRRRALRHPALLLTGSLAVS